MRRLLILTLAVILLAGPVEAASGPPKAVALEVRRQQLERLLEKLTHSRRQLQDVRRREHRVLGELESIDRSREATERRLAELSAELTRSRTAAQATATQLSVTERRLGEQRARLSGRLRDIYKYGRTGYVDLLLGSDDISEFLTRWHFISTIVGADGRLIVDYADDIEEYRALVVSLRREQERLAGVGAQTAARRREILVQEDTKRAALNRLQRERAAYEEMVRELEEDSRELEVLIRRNQSTASGRSVAMARTLAGFIWPSRGVFTSGFGIRRHPLFGIRRMHTGQDIAAPYGSPVQAAADGRVIYTGWFGGYGKIVLLDHGGGLSTLYAHLSGILTSEGASVRRGQVIGRVGSTGYSTGPHVHFEIRVNGTPIDPANR